MLNRKVADIPKGTLDMMILSVLAEAPNHGYGIVRRINEASAHRLTAEEGSLYPALWRLAEAGLVSWKWERSESNRKAKLYQITPSGRRELDRELVLWKSFTQAINGVLRLKPKAAPGTGSAGS